MTSIAFLMYSSLLFFELDKLVLSYYYLFEYDLIIHESVLNIICLVKTNNAQFLTYLFLIFAAEMTIDASYHIN